MVLKLAVTFPYDISVFLPSSFILKLQVLGYLGVLKLLKSGAGILYSVQIIHLSFPFRWQETATT